MSPLRSPFAVVCKGATLSGEMILPEDENVCAVVVSMLPERLSWEKALTRHLLADAAGMLRIGLRTPEEEERAAGGKGDLPLPLLAHRLLEVLDAFKRRWRNGEFRTLSFHIPDPPPLSFFAAGDFSPVALRIAALRDAEIRALACCGGLIDLAGKQYLKALVAPLLMIAEAGDIHAFTAAERCRALIAAEYEHLSSAIPAIHGGVSETWRNRRRRRPALCRGIPNLQVGVT
ncbi:MAG: hypothetical protein FWD77_11600, partial [Betaproteobacteria bacterium]|nr:hypothetical protein [Betaproteobacteria bacterium]